MLRDLGYAAGARHVLPLEDSDVPHLRALARVFRAEAVHAFDDVETDDEGSQADLPGERRSERLDRLTELLVPSDHQAFLYVLADLVAGEGPEAVELFDELLSPDQQLAFLDDVWRVNDEITAFVLEVIASLTPHKRVAKAARNALIQHRSHVANLTNTAGPPRSR